ncbi:MAG: PAS domain-containing protein [Desulfarculaceae bacterium]|nr:PAS domain-containing protein [Desulfarculaceae bacterium]MCF8073594.1 PAS domain-containing protein [Desulfarculaceae bacterium]MCF8103751.1 PAS domain-containing protein [Desulfarculaceae bacterium]MCF8115690.1 PAS domain-containing protein [Desulfarculaceae bacterium]
MEANTLGLDIRTLFAALTLVAACLAVALSFTALTQKTYPGFKQWTLAAVAMAASYFLLMIRGTVPLGVSVILGNGCFAAAAALFFAGTRRFLGLGPMPRYQLVVPLAAMVLLAWFYWGHEWFAMRALAISLGIAALLLPVAWWLFHHAPRGQRPLYGGTAGVILLFCLAVLGRLLDTLLQGTQLVIFSQSMVQAGYFLLAIPLQTLWLVGFLIINQTRLSDELTRSKAELAITADNLERILDFLPDPTWVVDQEGRVLFWNRAVEELTGIKARDMLGKGGYEYALPFYGERRPILIDLVRERDDSWASAYLTLSEKDGRLISSRSFHPLLGAGGTYLAGTAACLYDEQGRVIGAIETVRDISQGELDRLEREALIDQLQEALNNVKTLKGLIPICSHCKKIRRDEGYWERLEAYISEHSEAEFSHGICPECREKYYNY